MAPASSQQEAHWLIQMTNRRRRVAMVLYGSLPFDTRVKREARALASAGYEVTVYDTDWLMREVNNLQGIRRVSVTKVPIRRRASKTHLLRFWIAAIRALLSRRGQIDIVHAHDLTGLPPAVLLKIVSPRTRLVYDSHELFPEAALDKVSKVAYLAFLVLELLCGLFVDRVITVGPLIASVLQRRIHAPTEVVMNVPDVHGIRERLKAVPTCQPTEIHRPVRIAYSGNVLLYRGYEELVSAAEILKQNSPGRYEFWIIGGGPFLERLQAIVKERGLEEMFVFTGQVSFEELISKTAQCDLAVGLYGKIRNNNLAVPNKLFEYMMLGIPMIFTRLTQSLPILQRVGAVVVSNPIISEELAEAIRTLSEDTELRRKISEKSQELVRSRFNWGRESEKLLRVYRGLE